MKNREVTMNNDEKERKNNDKQGEKQGNMMKNRGKNNET